MITISLSLSLFENTGGLIRFQPNAVSAMEENRNETKRRIDYYIKGPAFALDLIQFIWMKVASVSVSCFTSSYSQPDFVTRLSYEKIMVFIFQLDIAKDHTSLRPSVRSADSIAVKTRCRRGHQQCAWWHRGREWLFVTHCIVEFDW